MMPPSSVRLPGPYQQEKQLVKEGLITALKETFLAPQFSHPHRSDFNPSTPLAVTTRFPRGTLSIPLDSKKQPMLILGPVVQPAKITRPDFLALAKLAREAFLARPNRAVSQSRAVVKDDFDIFGDEFGTSTDPVLSILRPLLEEEYETFILEDEDAIKAIKAKRNAAASSQHSEEPDTAYEELLPGGIEFGQRVELGEEDDKDRKKEKRRKVGGDLGQIMQRIAKGGLQRLDD